MHADNMPSAEPAPRESVGQLLRMTRASHGVDLPHVAEALRIRLAFLQAIEDGRNQDLPGPTYAVGFVRAYADYLGLDGEEIVRRYKAETSIVPRKADLEFPTPVNEGGIPTGAMLLIAALLGAGIYGGWYWMSSADRTVAELIQEVPERFNDLLAAAPEAGEEGAAVVEALAQSADRMLTGAEPPAPAPASDPAAAPDPAPADPAADAAPNAPAVAAVEPAPVVDPAPAGAPTVEPPPAASVPADPAPAAENPETADATGPSPAAAPEAPDAAAEPVAPGSVERVPEERQVAVAPPSEPTVPQPPPAEEPASAAEPAPEPAAEPETEAAAAPAPATEETSAPEPEPAPVAEEQQMAAVPAAPDLPEPVAALDGAVYGAPAGSTRVVLAATQDSWIQVRAGEELIATRLLREGERFQVPDRRGLTLMVGNAGGLRIVVDGRTLPPLGDQGEVRRGIRLAPDALLSN
ncbi:helix-turn-helix domain-containing protein [Caenispirillum salinarum]|uniref:helix-turn-helix domain-containing protein n=1 Tax=Caenispirillum salinarum TaxID=859058 RepID=UPI00384DFE40